MTQVLEAKGTGLGRLARESWGFLPAVLLSGCSQNAPQPQLERLQQQEASAGMDKLGLTFPVAGKEGFQKGK